MAGRKKACGCGTPGCTDIPPLTKKDMKKALNAAEFKLDMVEKGQMPVGVALKLVVKDFTALAELFEARGRALDKADEAMCVWVHHYAPEFCYAREVKKYREIVSKAGGTLGYIGDVTKVIREARPKVR
jgi:hypothetical protein